MSKQTRRMLEVTLVAIVVLMVLGRLPKCNYVKVSGPDGTTVVESSGPGPHVIRVDGNDGSVAISGSW